MHFSQEISHRSLAGCLAVQAGTSRFPGVAELAQHHSISWQWNGMGPVFPRSLIMVSGSGEADGGKQLLTGSQGHLPKAWEGNVATGKVKKVWAAKPEHPHLALNLWHCLATSSLVERSRGEKGRHWQGWHDAFPQVPQRTAKCKASLSARPLRFQRHFYIFPLHLAIGHALLSPGISTVSTPAGTGGREGGRELPLHSSPAILRTSTSGTWQRRPGQLLAPIGVSGDALS